MRLIHNRSTDPAFNLAAEEYLLSSAREPVYMLWRNENAVIVGKNQDTLAEIDPAYVEAHGIRVHRRMTGGGAVYHDLGNVNYTIIQPEDGQFNDYAYFTADLIAFLATLGVQAKLNERNDIFIDNRKFCGNAQCVKGGRVLHHGCILFDTDLSMLRNVLKPKKGRGVASVASRVVNLREYIDMSTDAFLEAFAAFLHCDAYQFTAEEFIKIKKLADEKYNTWEWNFGVAPAWDGPISPA